MVPPCDRDGPAVASSRSRGGAGGASSGHRCGGVVVPPCRRGSVAIPPCRRRDPVAARRGEAVAAIERYFGDRQCCIENEYHGDLQVQLLRPWYHVRWERETGFAPGGCTPCRRSVAVPPSRDTDRAVWHAPLAGAPETVTRRPWEYSPVVDWSLRLRERRETRDPNPHTRSSGHRRPSAPPAGMWHRHQGAPP